ncbi:MAG: sn-glycerol-3-phosphate ABC transporter ATP-binding protein UgpC [Bacteroidota bacterium]
MASIELKHIQKVYPGADRATIENADLSIKDKEFIVLVGPSGCGKSTLLRMIAGLEEITGGDMMIEDIRVNELSPKDRDIAFVFQNYALYPHMTVYENMAFGLKLRKTPKAKMDALIKEAAETLNITHLLDRRPKDMSGGQRQRVAIGRAIVRDPKVFLFDEPLSNLDASLRVQMRSEIRRLHRELQATMVYVTHDQIEAMTMGDRIVVLKDGKVMQFDTPINLFNNPQNKFVAGFIGSPSMNFLHGHIHMEGEKIQFRSEDMYFSLPPSFREKLMPYVDKKIIYGFRPEYVYDKALETERQLSEDVKMKVVSVEPIGSESYIYFSYLGCPGNVFCMRSSSQTPYKIGQVATVGVDIGRLRFFDAETEARVL